MSTTPTLRMGHHIEARGRTIDVALWYPHLDEEFNAVEIDLVAVRAAAPIRIEFDFDRNGWSISRRFDLDTDDPDHVWQEVAFVDADRRRTEP